MGEVLQHLTEGRGIWLTLLVAFLAGGGCVLLVTLAWHRFRSGGASADERTLAQFRQLTDATFSGVLAYRHGVILDVNAALCRFMGCQASELVGHKLTEFVAPHCVDRLLQRIKDNALENEEFDVIVKSGEQRTVEVITRIVEYAGGDARVTALRDITERKRDDMLRSDERRILTGIAENRPLSETLNRVCRAAEAVLPGSMCSVLLITPEGRVHTVAAPNLPEAYSRAIEGAPIGPCAGSCGTAAYRKQTVIVADIETDPLWADYKQYALPHGLRACWSVPLIARNGRVLGTFATYHKRPYAPGDYDLGVIDRLAASAAIAIQRSQMHEDLIAARDHAEAASRAKSDFLANMSHELRTPLNAILGFSEIISRQTLGPDAQGRYIEYANDIHESGTYLLSLITDILDVARVEAGKVRIDRERCGVAAVVEEQLRVIRRAYPDAAPVVPKLETDCPDLLVDHRAFGQVLINVIGNAAKFTPAEGAITVSCDARGPGLRVRIEDTGPGIPANMLEEIGKPFRQVASAYNRRHPGTGLGLYISRSLMRLHGGELEVASTFGKGTTITLVFPEECVLREAREAASTKVAMAGQ